MAESKIEEEASAPSDEENFIPEANDQEESNAENDDIVEDFT